MEFGQRTFPHSWSLEICQGFVFMSAQHKSTKVLTSMLHLTWHRDNHQSPQAWRKFLDGLLRSISPSQTTIRPRLSATMVQPLVPIHMLHQTSFNLKRMSLTATIC